MGNVAYDEDFVILDEEPDWEHLPDWAPLFGLICRHLKEEEFLEEMATIVRPDRRAGSYGIVDIGMYLVAYFCAGQPEGGLRGFWEATKPYGDELAALAGRDRWPSSGSVSRFLKAVTDRQAQQLGEWALGEVSTPEGGYGEQRACWLDACGGRWHVIDWDPRARMFRRRALLEGDEWPEPKRWSCEQAAPGESGRKRGDIRRTRGVVAHAGTSQWMGSYVQPGNGVLYEGFQAIEPIIERWRTKADVAEGRVILRIDGEGDVVRLYHAVREAGWVPLVRVGRSGLLERSDIQRRLQQGRWRQVPDTGGGPTREACEVGEVRLHSGRKVDEPDAQEEPLELRLVVSRYPADEASEDGPGVHCDGMVYEIFGFDGTADRWPAPCVVAAYFRRSTIENRFIQEDADLGLEETLSQDPAGQVLAGTIGHWVWNLEVKLGDRLAELDPRPEQVQKTDEGAEQSGDDSGGHTGTRSEADGTNGPEALSERTERRLADSGLVFRPGYGAIECARSAYLAYSYDKTDHGTQYAVFRAARGMCRGCPFRDNCMSSESQTYRKTVWIQKEEVPEAVRAKAQDRALPWGLRPMRTWVEGPMEVRPPQMLPAQLRRRLRQACRRARLEVQVDKPPDTLPVENPREWLHRHRTRRRMSYGMRRKLRTLHPDAEVKAKWHNAGPLTELIAPNE